ncbi:MAG: hypothetical protein MJB14_20900 [Spirochaetes bacterium]|nr:hypothetical protein [Spirochaetota bacterium]
MFYLKKNRLLFLLFTFLFTLIVINVVHCAEGEETAYLGNPLFSRKNIYLYQSAVGGLSGPVDYFAESTLLKFRFASKTRHAFAIRLNHYGYGPYLFTGQIEKFHFAVLLGFEYLYKIFSPISGVFLYLDAGICNLGFALSTGFGIGDRFFNGFTVNFTYLYHSCFFSVLDFYFTIVKYLSLRGKIGLDIKFSSDQLELFNFYTGIYPGITIKRFVKIEIGGGVTFNDNYVFRGYGGINLVLNFDF